MIPAQIQEFTGIEELTSVREEPADIDQNQVIERVAAQKMIASIVDEDGYPRVRLEKLGVQVEVFRGSEVQCVDFHDVDLRRLLKSGQSNRLTPAAVPDDEDGFRIERSSSRDPWAEIATVGPGVVVLEDDGLKRNTSYSYRVRAFIMDVNSAYSDTATAKTLKK